MTSCIFERCKGVGKIRNGNRAFIKGYCQRHYEMLLKGKELTKLKEIKESVKKDLRYNCYRAMLLRCLNSSNKNYTHYKKMGITVCKEWEDKDNGFDNFCKDMRNRPSLKHSLDRINNKLGYFKENCRWATVHEQGANRSNNNEFIGVRLTKLGSYRAKLTVNKITHEKHFKKVDDAILYRKVLELKYL